MAVGSEESVGSVERSAWRLDVLGEPYEASTLQLPDDEEGAVVGTLVRRRRAADRPARRAVLYLHGFIDYFFQTHLADHFVDAGWDFYALDLRKYGRSLLPHQTPNYTTSVADYAAEIDAAIVVVREEDGVAGAVLLTGHSTGGLVGALWAHHRRDRRLVDGVWLNSPYLDLNEPWSLKQFADRVVVPLSRVAPRQLIPSTLSEHYVHSIHASLRGSWQFDLNWKPAEGFPVRAAWVAAIRRAQHAVFAGLDIDVPVLVMSSTRSVRPKRWDDLLFRADGVLDADRIAELAWRVGRHVTVVRIDGGMHDLVLSAEPVRQRVFAELDRWTAAYLPG